MTKAKIFRMLRFYPLVFGKVVKSHYFHCHCLKRIELVKYLHLPDAMIPFSELLACFN